VVNLPIWILEPEREDKRVDYARRLVLDQPKDEIPQTQNIEDVRIKLRAIRHNTRANIDASTQKLQDVLHEKFPGVEVTLANTSADAVSYIEQNAGNSKIIATNNSALINQELKLGLKQKGFTITNSYLHEFAAERGKVRNYWELPRLFDQNLSGTFDVVRKNRRRATGRAEAVYGVARC